MNTGHSDQAAPKEDNTGSVDPKRRSFKKPSLQMVLISTLVIFTALCGLLLYGVMKILDSPSNKKASYDSVDLFQAMMPLLWDSESRHHMGKAEIHLFQAQMECAKRNYDAMRDSLTAANEELSKIESRPKLVAPLYLIEGTMEWQFSKWKESIAFFDKAIAGDPNRALNYDCRGRSYMQLGSYGKAIADFTKAVELEPDSFAAYEQRACAQFYVDDYDKSIQDYSKAISLSPETARLYEGRGRVFGFKCEFQKALKDFDKAISLEPGEPSFYVSRISADEWLGKYQDAIADATKAIECDPTDFEPYQERASAYIHERQYDKAIQDADEALEQNPKSSHALCIRAKAYTFKGEDRRAIDDYGDAIKFLRKDETDQLGTIYFRRGAIYKKVGEAELAAKDFEQARAHDYFYEKEK
jgi:tetratricopeptide (TPR) repeat protein